LRQLWEEAGDVTPAAIAFCPQRGRTGKSRHDLRHRHARSRFTISAMLATRCSFENPKRRSLAPGCRMTILVPLGTALSRRRSMPAVVSPRTPALVTVAWVPFLRKIVCSAAVRELPRPIEARPQRQCALIGRESRSAPRIHCILSGEGSLNVEPGQPAIGQRCRGETSMKMRSSCVPNRSTLATPECAEGYPARAWRSCSAPALGSTRTGLPRCATRHILGTRRYTDRAARRIVTYFERFHRLGATKAA
jgi:hypothetical protein